MGVSIEYGYLRLNAYLGTERWPKCTVPGWHGWSKQHLRWACLIWSEKAHWGSTYRCVAVGVVSVANLEIQADFVQTMSNLSCIDHDVSRASK